MESGVCKAYYTATCSLMFCVLDQESGSIYYTSVLCLKGYQVELKVRLMAIFQGGFVMLEFKIKRKVKG